MSLTVGWIYRLRLSCKTFYRSTEPDRVWAGKDGCFRATGWRVEWRGRATAAAPLPSVREFAGPAPGEFWSGHRCMSLVGIAKRRAA
jgi:hypothetical protein